MNAYRCALKARGSLRRSTSEAIEAATPFTQVARFGNSVRPEAPEDNPPSKSQLVNPDDVDHEREFILSVLSTTATKRDARSYLARYTSQKPSLPKLAKKVQDAANKDVAAAERHNDWRLKKTGVNLGNLYVPAKAIQESPVFAHQPLPEKTPKETDLPLHVALVKVREPQLWDEATLYGVSLTLGQLVRLGLNIAVVIDPDEETTPEILEKFTNDWRRKVMQQSDRLVEALRRHTPAGALRVNDALSLSTIEQELPSSVQVRGGVEVEYPNLLLPLLQSGTIPVIPPIAFTRDDFKISRVHPDDVVLALTRELSGIRSRALAGEYARPNHATLLEKVIVLDPLGGIPFPNRDDRAHVFINLEQEYPQIRKDLTEATEFVKATLPKSNGQEQSSVLGNSNPFSKFAEREIPSLYVEPRRGSRAALSSAGKPSRHLKNLDLVQRALTLLPPSSSALIVTPAEAAISAGRPSFVAPGVATRRSKNPLIHNLLTDKPLVSSSHPDSPIAAIPSILPATFVKRGMPLSVFPDTQRAAWMPPRAGEPTMDLANDARIDLPRLIHLIEDSFGRRLDVPHYLERIRGRLAGVIIAGEYEGGAIITWEQPPPIETATGPVARPPVPYLDKFAVLKRAQGAGGVADVVFKAMVRSCLPDGVVWRSRRDNPVNKWYFERATGTLKLDAWDQTKWTMFWTTQGVERDEALWRDYQAVCAGIRASWADTKPPD
ncbi:uncharacterized protein K452DRAFT_266065 [Aplosporella prunicola CBS 121167]|uniref:Amino-acid acetyltransferase, mitochondrial n=1 Tax=Aplosporella prunicola CBS 121167 TaxID=1176127 RepID=A0A6A6BPA6_9PEZI|nr:uncharacterized protein K452DRAFT_266065 [Aplosporella prunicola CBS 121167]KAF2145283.1 hypothetical protein K452DRAFT_266065 [Aplosporella prunicola CBS 121167]